MGTRTGARGDCQKTGLKMSFHPGKEEERRRPGYLLGNNGKWEKEGRHNWSIYHKLNDFHKRDSQMGAAHPTSSHLQVGFRLEAQR